MFKKYLFVLYLSIFNFYTLIANEITSPRFLLIAPGSRPNAMGEAFTAIADDNNAIYWNPAGISNLSKKEISFTHIKGIVYTNMEYLIYVRPVNKIKGTLGASIYYMYDSQARTNEQGEFEGDFNNNSLVGILSYGKKIVNVIDIGASLKYIRWKLDTKIAKGFAIDVGLLKQNLFSKLNVGLSFQNIGLKMKFIEEKFSLPVVIKLGVGYKLLEDNLILALDTNHYVNDITGFNIGAEYVMKKMFFIRCGYKYFKDIVKLKHLGGISLGVGFGVDGYSLDYAFVPYGELGDMHRISFIIKF
ncbi:MAG: PorV/PorQ family protein [Elusimicrobiota bacterium]